MSITRRQFSQLALAGTAAAATRINPYHHGVRLGAQSYSFRDRGLDAAIAGMKEVGIGTVEMYSGPRLQRNHQLRCPLQVRMHRVE